ncbi:hypothetical protein HAX54_029419, partial [Datura stramonium]|nr:hypothetical protein [Datura stramonium]
GTSGQGELWEEMMKNWRRHEKASDSQGKGHREAVACHGPHKANARVTRHHFKPHSVR